MPNATWGLSRLVAGVFGVIYVLIGVLGFIPGLVTGGALGDMPSADGSLLGIFPVNLVHNLVHLAIGAALLWGATSRDAAVTALRVVGGVYLLVGVLGLVAPDTFGLMPIGGSDIWLHLASALIFIGVTFIDTDRETRMA